MVKTKDEILEAIKNKLGEEISDEDITLLEDVTDTLNDYENKAKSETNTDWKAKYEENDKAWKKRYTDRFFNKEENDNDDVSTEINIEGNDNKPHTFDDLFSTGEE